MKCVTYESEISILEFTNRAKDHFENNKKSVTYTYSDIVAGCLFATRWGLSDDCILVFRLDDDFEPVNFQQIIKEAE